MAIFVTLAVVTAIEVFVGLQDHGSVSFDVFYDPIDLGQAALLASRASSESKAAVLTLSDGKILSFNAYCKTFPINGTKNEKIKSNVTLRITGDVILT